MDIILYSVSDPPNKVNKSLGHGTSVSGVVFKERDYLNVINPTIRLNLGNEVSDISLYNYVYIARFTRYYYIDNISTDGGLVEIECRVDPLKSFAKDIYASKQYVIRSQTRQNRYLVDPLLPMQSDHKYYTKVFGNPVYDEHCHNVILETIGTGVSE